MWTKILENGGFATERDVSLFIIINSLDHTDTLRSEFQFNWNDKTDNFTLRLFLSFYLFKCFPYEVPHFHLHLRPHAVKMFPKTQEN